MIYCIQLVVASQAVGAYNSLQARSLSGSPICSSQNIRHSLGNAMSFKGHFEMLMLQQSPLKSAEQSVFPLVHQLSPSFYEQEPLFGKDQIYTPLKRKIKK